MYKSGDWVWWRTPPNVNMSDHGFPPNCLVKVQLTTDYDPATAGYETENRNGGEVSVLEHEILELAD